MKNLQAAVDIALPPNQARPSTEQIVQSLQELHAGANSALQADLQNLLIAALVTAEGEAIDNHSTATGKLTTQIWSYRRLLSSQKIDGQDVVENWGPTIVVHPNEVLFIPVLNLLDRDELAHATVPEIPGKRLALHLPLGVPTSNSAGGPDIFDNAPHDFDVTNLHTHGLNVSPDWPSDDIFRQIHPGQLKFYIYSIPSDHPTGTYFYHPHHHGSVATQVAGGMAGALLVVSETDSFGKLRGLDQAALDWGWSDQDKDNGSYPHVLLIQQLSLFRDLDPQVNQGKLSPLFTRPDFFAMKDMGPWTGDVEAQLPWVTLSDRPMLARLAKILQKQDPTYSMVESYMVTTWANGRFQPTLTALQSKEIRRLRLIHAGVEANVELTIRWKAPADENRYTIDTIQYQVIARDGLPLPIPQIVGSAPTDYLLEGGSTGYGETGTLTLAPGNRADVLISTPRGKTDGVLELYYLDGDGIEQIIAVLPIAGEVSALPTGQTRAFLSQDSAQDIYNNPNNIPTIPPQPGAAHDFVLTFADAQSQQPVANVSPFEAGTFQVNLKSFPSDTHSFKLETHSCLRLEVVKPTPPGPSPDTDLD